MSPLAARTAIVTGASRGIGAAIAAALGEAGARVARVARSLQRGEHDGFDDWPCDLTDAAAVAAFADEYLAAQGAPDVVVSNAGSFVLQPLEATSPADFDGQIAHNLRSAFLVARALLPAMRRAGRGSFISVGSVVDHVGFPDNAAYAASKYGLRGLHETLLAEFRGSGVRLTLVSPGPTDTAVWDPIDPDSRDGFPKRTQMLRPADVANAVLFAASQPAHVHVDWIRLGPT